MPFTSKLKAHTSPNHNIPEQDLPVCIAAAGMIGSSLGLAELVHVTAPAGLQEIADSSRWFKFPATADLPFLLVPGVRSGPGALSSDPLNEMDAMRGEETLCLGLIDLGLVSPPAVVLNLGSHWKAIRIDAGGFSRASLRCPVNSFMRPKHKPCLPVQVHSNGPQSYPSDGLREE